MAAKAKVETVQDDAANPFGGAEGYEWETVQDESPTTVIMDKPGDEVVGYYQGAREIQNEKKKGTPDEFFTIHVFRALSGELFALPNGYKLEQGLKDVPKDTLTRVLYVKDIDTDNQQPMKDYKIQTAKS